jgi:hypothetical protein
MAEIDNLILLDWRSFGDFSAVGQLTKKIFSKVDGQDIYSIQTDFNGPKSKISKVEDGETKAIVNWKMFQDAVVKEVKLIRGSKALYVRLSPSKSTLELAVKLKLAIDGLKVIVHYMDKPFLEEYSISMRRYILNLYSFLIKNSDLFLTINESSIKELSNSYFVSPEVLGNFVDLETFTINKETTRTFRNNKYVATYFGSLDKKMNYVGVLDFCRAIACNKNVTLNIWTNSGLWGPLKELVESNFNINCGESKFSETEYKNKLTNSDFLVLPYNPDISSSEFLQHSFSNKLVDYIEAGTQVLVYGPASIPTIEFCISNEFGCYFSSKEELNAFFSDSQKLKNANEVNYSESLLKFVSKSNYYVDKFLESITKMSANDGLNFSHLPEPCSEEFIKSQLNFLIRRKFLDVMTEKQSLSASISAHMLKKCNYKGFDFEI